MCYHPDEIQIITGGTDRKIGYWELYDGTQIRELDGSQSGSINGMDICGGRFVTGSSDKLIKLWLYNEGDVTHIGKQPVQGVHYKVIGRWSESVIACMVKFHTVNIP